jgi:DNA-binding response OmpR family regulator
LFVMLATDTVTGRVLVVEDDAAIADVLRRALRQEGHEVRSAQDGVEALEMAEAFVPDLVILDLGLPKRSGLDVLRALRGAANRVPVLILTALDDLQSRVQGLDAGADDFLGKPFELAELKARIRALVRRGAAANADVVGVGGVSLDRTARAAHVNGQPIELEGADLALLELLLNRPGHLVSRDQIVAQLAESGHTLSMRDVEENARRLSARLAPGGVSVVSVPGLGLSLEKQP